MRFLVELPVAGEHDRLHQLDQEKQLSVDLLVAAVHAYVGQLTRPPLPFPRLELYHQDEHPHRQFVDARLWVDGEESDLTLQCTLFTDHVEEGRYAYAITGILVM